MYQILIADDEKDERNVVHFLLKKFRFELNILEAENGRDALALLNQHKIDILFTDVRMPFLYGTDLAVYARRLYPDIQILFFSGYDDFDYAKKALTIGAVEYILKPIHPEEFKKAIQKAVKKLNTQKQMQEKQKIAVTYMKNYILSYLLNGAKIENIQNEYDYFDLSFLNEFEYMLLIQFDTEVFDLKPQSFFEKNTAAALNAQPFHFINLNSCQSIVFLQHTNFSSPNVFKNAQRLQKQLTNVCNKPCYLSVSEPLKGAYSIKPAYEKAESQLEERFFYSDIYLYPIHDYSNTKENKHHQDDSLIQTVNNAIRYKDIYSLNKSIKIILKKYSKKQNQSPIYVRYIFSQLSEILCRALPENSDELCEKVLASIYMSKHFSEIQELVSNILNKVMDKLEKEQESPKHAIYLVQQYIQNNYNSELSLEKLAEHVFLSPHYLSDLFIRETGFGINKYIKNIRMEKAKELLLNTNLRVQDICKKVGYSNNSYFCRSFRENYGKTPDSYRQIKQ